MDAPASRNGNLEPHLYNLPTSQYVPTCSSYALCPSTTPVVLLKSPHQQWAQGNVLLPEFPAALNMSAQDAVYPWPQQQLSTTLMSPPYVVVCSYLFFIRTVHLSTTPVVLL